MTVYYSSDFGWSDGQDISDEFIALVANTLQPGDTLVLEGMYQISGENIQLPDGFTLSAVQGAGLDIVDTSDHNKPLLLMGNGGKIDNVTFLASESPNTGYEGTHAQMGVDFHTQRAVGVIEVNNVTISNCDFSGNLTSFVEVVSSDGVVIEGTHFEGSLRQVYLVGDTKDVYISGSHFENPLGDGIKTERGGEYGPQRITVVDSLFEGANRDAIDTAGGFKDSLISNTVFYDNNVSALDLKTILERTSDLSPNISNSGIRIEDCQIINSQNGIVVTMLDRMGVLTASNADDLMPHDIQVVNTIFENITKNAFLVKDGYNITWTDLTFLGNFNELRLMNAEAPNGWTAYNVEGSVSTQGAPRGLSADDLWPNDVGPVDGPLGGNEPINGTNGADVIYGNGSTIWAAGGNDTLFAGDGADTMHGQGGNDTVSYAGSAAGVGARLDGIVGWGEADGDTIFTVENLIGSAYKDTLVGSNGANLLQGGGGNDTIFALAGDDTVEGGAGNDTLYGQAGTNLLQGGAGNDTLISGTGADAMDGGSGTGDTVSYAIYGTGVGARLDGIVGWGGASGDTIQNVENLIGTAYKDTLVGSNGANLLQGGGGNDTIFALAGDDTLEGGAGDDILYGQGGNDRFIFSDGFGNDVIMDFRANNDLEKIDLSAVSAITSYADLTNPGNPHMTQVGANVVIDDFAGNTITLEGVDLAHLNLIDFVF